MNQLAKESKRTSVEGSRKIITKTTRNITKNIQQAEKKGFWKQKPFNRELFKPEFEPNKQNYEKCSCPNLNRKLEQK